jgi:hypothetical protein
MKIARDPRLQKAASMQVLPMAWSTLYELTKLDDEAFKQAVGSGAISELTTLDDARALRPRYIPQHIRHPDYAVRLDSIRSRYSAPASAPPPLLTLVADNKDDAQDQQPITILPRVTIHQIERLVRDLQAEIERGTVVVDAAFTMSARSVAGQLLDMADRYARRH